MKEKKKDVDKELIELRHKYKMEELEYERATFKLVHQWKLEAMRIKNAEIRKNELRRQSYRR